MKIEVEATVQCKAVTDDSLRGKIRVSSHPLHGPHDDIDLVVGEEGLHNCIEVRVRAQDLIDAIRRVSR